MVTGATGFIGSALVQRLVAESFDVRALVRPTSDASSLESLVVEIARGDFQNRDQVERAVRDCELVFHLAKSSQSELSPAETNATGAANVAHAAVQTGVTRVVFSSSTTVYGVVKNREITELTPVKPSSPYAKSKVAAEHVLLSHHDSDGLPVVIARISSVFGSGVSGWRDVFQAVATGSFRLIGSGNNYYQPGDVSDIVEGLFRCGVVPGIDGRMYIITGDEPVRLCEMIDLIQDEFGVTNPNTPLPITPLRGYKLINDVLSAWGGKRLPRMDSVEFFLSDRVFDLSHARSELGYVPKVSARETIRRTVQWYREQGFPVDKEIQVA